MGACCEFGQPRTQSGRLLRPLLQDGTRPLHEESSQVRVRAFANPEQLLLSTGGIFARDDSEPGRERSPLFEGCSVADRRNDGGRCNGRTTSPPSLTLIALRFHQYFPHSFEATRDARCAARHNKVTVGVEDFKGNCISERVPVNTDLDGAGESVCLYPDPGRAKNECFGDRAVIVVVGVPPGTQTGRG
jgi:hypothetical protein